MDTTQAILEMSRTLYQFVGRFEQRSNSQDEMLAELKADVAELKAAPAKKRQARVTWRTGLLTALAVTAFGTVGGCLGRIIIGH